LDIGVLGYFGIVQHKEHFPEVLSIHPEKPCIHIYIVYLSLSLNALKKLAFLILKAFYRSKEKEEKLLIYTSDDSIKINKDFIACFSFGDKSEMSINY
jgi:hypothetical protein